MILHAIELTYVGPFGSGVRIGPFSKGLNVLAAPNEAGKSTAIRAAARALFDRHTTKSEEIKALQPTGTDLAPRIAVEFETGTGRYRVEKTFLLSPRSLLQQWNGSAWQPLAEADAADLRVQDLLKSSIPGRGATKPEHWGFLGFLWARQGEPVEWPKLEDAAVGQQIRARLARIELDPAIERLREKLFSLAEAIITSTGQPKTNGPLKTAEDDLATIESDLAKLRQNRADLEAKDRNFHQLTAEVLQLEKEHADKVESAKTLSVQTLAAERLGGELQARQAELNSAQEKLSAVSNDASTLAQRKGELVAAKSAVELAASAEAAAAQKLAAIRVTLDEKQATRPAIETKRNSLRNEHSRIQDLLKLRQSVSEAAILRKQVTKAEQTDVVLTSLREKKSKIPAITPAKARKLEESSEQVRELKAQVQALGLTVELTPDVESKIVVQSGDEARAQTLRAKTKAILRSPQSLEVKLKGWGHLSVRSGAKEAQSLTEDLAAAEKELRALLVEAEVADVQAARDALNSRKDLETQIKAAESSLEDQLGEHDSLERLRDAEAAAIRRRDALAASVQPTTEEEAASVTHLEGEDARLPIAINAAEKELKSSDKAVEELRAEERTFSEASQVALKQSNDRRTELRTIETQISELSGRYAEGVDQEKTKTQIEFAKAEARVAAVRASLPPEFEKLPERNRRAASALQQLASDLQLKRAARDAYKGSLETLGGMGLYSLETELEEKKVEAEKRRNAARTKAWAARIAHDLIEFRKQAATRAVLAPLEQRLSAAFSDLTGDTRRGVYLDDQLQIAGVGRSRSESHAFDLLSQGAKEQLLLCLRIAVAQELSVTEPQVLLLDDVLVNTDQVRQERVLDSLGALAASLQVIILTCHPDRYRGVGSTVAFGRRDSLTNQN